MAENAQDQPQNPALVWDNREHKVAEFLQQRLSQDSVLRAVSAYFSIYGYGALLPEIDKIGKIRFLFGEPASVADPDPNMPQSPPFSLGERGLELTKTLSQKPLAVDCMAWIKSKAEIRTIKQANLLHGKMYHIEAADGECLGALAGSSNFTAAGFGASAAANIELNLAARDAAACGALAEWFDEIWNDGKLCRDAKEDVLAALARLAKDYSPAFLYYKTLYELFYERLQAREEEDKRLGAAHLFDSEIWKKLYEFQKDGVRGAIHRLLARNGCVIADSVGLGKTFEALAIIKFFELRGGNCLVLCPARMEENWKRFSARYERVSNPLGADQLGYRVLAHTDLSRDKGKKDDLNLADFSWGNYDLIVIDESHNFRNAGGGRHDKHGRPILSRYQRLMKKAIQGGVQTRVLMLSATPVNTDLSDLRNQIYLMTAGRDGVFGDLGVSSLQYFFAAAQRRFKEWEKARAANADSRGKAELIEKLGGGFLTLLDAVSIARSRSHIENHYPEIKKELGGFPTRAAPQSVSPPTDAEGELSYDQMHDQISAFRLSIYSPSAYPKDAAAPLKKDAQTPFTQLDRERFLIGMLRMNFLKRLESSAHAFALTLERTRESIEKLRDKISRYEGGGDIYYDAAPDEDEEDDEFVVGKRVQYHFSELDLRRWKKDLDADYEVLGGIYQIAARVTPARDAKLNRLIEILRDKAENPSINKDGKQRRKALVFTAFADTAKYLYEQLQDCAREAGVNIALVTGGGDNRATVGGLHFAEILDNFSPVSRMAQSKPAAPKTGGDQGKLGLAAQSGNWSRHLQKGEGSDGELDLPPRERSGGEIDFLIATDCIAEGQDLQDCDLVINYDIHWNPVRLIQRFGRIDRIGSRAREVRMINFWPTENLDRYLNLTNRVEARMALADAAATGMDDPLINDGGDSGQTAKDSAQMELDFRNEQLRRIREGAADWDERMDGRLEMSDFTLDDFIAELATYLEANEAELKAAPAGIYAVAAAPSAADKGAAAAAAPGAVFCFRHLAAAAGDGKTARKPNPLHPYFLVYVRDDGEVRYRFGQAKQILAMMGALCRGRDTLPRLGDVFNRETDNGRRMAKYDALVRKAVESVGADYTRAAAAGLSGDRSFKLPDANLQPRGMGDFELITWLIIKRDGE